MLSCKYEKTRTRMAYIKWNDIFVRGFLPALLLNRLNVHTKMDDSVMNMQEKKNRFRDIRGNPIFRFVLMGIVL